MMDKDPVPATPPPTARREDLARAWTGAATSTAYIPRAIDELETILLELVDEVLAALADDSTSTPAATGETVGARLVEEGFTDPHALRASIEVLTAGLLGELDRTPDSELARRTVALLGAMSAGYADGLRNYTLTQQERLKQALFNAMVRAEHNLRATENRFQEVFASSAVGIAITDLDGMCVESNPALGQILGCSPNQLAGRMLPEFFVTEDPLPTPGLAGPRPVPGSLAETYRRVLDGEAERVQEQRRLRTVDGETAWVVVGISLLHDGAGSPAYFVTMIQDVSELRLLSDRLGHQLLHDALTGLPNRQQFTSKLETTLGRAAPDATVTLCVVNLDGFALVNNSLGHDVGDRLLRTVGQRLEAAVAAERAMVARLGGDEFAVLIEDLPVTPDIDDLIAQINVELAEPEYLDGRGVGIGASTGAVRCRAADMSAGELFRAADTALRKAKATGKRQWAGFHSHEDDAARERDALAVELPAAWENGQLTVAYEPVVLLGTERVVAARPVLSWQRDEETVHDHRFCVELAERTGLTVQLVPQVLGEVGRRLPVLREVFAESLGEVEDPLVRIQLTRAQTGDADLARAVHRALRGVATPGLLEVALDTGAVLDDVGDARDNLDVLVDIGVSTGLCGFQGGPRELELLADSPVRSVTLDPDGIGAAGRDTAGEVLRTEVARLVRAIVDGGRECSVLDPRTPAEAAWWASAGAVSAQGGLFGAPVAADELPGLPRVPTG
ncbi:diguanylate cyclase domain-containing protein [Actinophytocola gossypii]|uniref:Diguanylate cyclase n=1 Tax=Actinophytocola gossypii TaxID=2812003 RepID=A0ABT2JEZ1_9PSEU|nr:diguanylate cyclase [Actinophytocola gossypii]MCT2586323.1 diguanylate cyclase [Actinophytocola gossypii]